MASLAPVSQVSQEASYTHQGSISLTDSVLVVGLTAYGRSPSEAYGLFVFMHYVIPYAVKVYGHVLGGLEARVTEGTEDLDMRESEDAKFKIEVCLLNGLIENVAGTQWYGPGPTNTRFVSAGPESVTIEVQRTTLFKGRHEVTIFYQPKPSGTQ